MKKCILCRKGLKHSLYSMSNMPDRVQRMERRYSMLENDNIELTLYQCGGCGLVQFDCDAVEYYRDVIRAGRVSDELRRLRAGQYQYLIDKYGLQNKRVWEVGCGAGEFLHIWKDFPVESFGIENDPELVGKACAEDLHVIQGFVGDEYIDPRGPFDCFVSFNYLEHQPDPCGMVSCIYNNLAEGGIGLVTVPSFEFFMEAASYYEFMRDHIAYYTEGALTRLFELNGFDVLEVSRFNGDTTQMIVKKRAMLQFPDFDGQKNRIEKTLNTFITEHNIEDVVVWGASHQGLTMMATLSFAKPIKYVVDSASFKWDCYTPVSHLRIKKPEALITDNIDLIIIMAPAFSDEIANSIRTNYTNVKYILAIKDGEVIQKE